MTQTPDAIRAAAVRTLDPASCVNARDLCPLCKESALLLARWALSHLNEAPADYDWFMSIGGIETSRQGDCPSVVILKDIRFICHMNHSELWVKSQTALVNICDDPTRRDVRDLARMLGVELQEPPA